MKRREYVRLGASVGFALLIAAAFAIPAWGALARAEPGSEPSAVAPAPAVSEPSAADREAMKEEAARHLACMREQGFDLPDAVVSDEGVWISLDGLDATTAAFERALQECTPAVPAIAS